MVQVVKKMPVEELQQTEAKASRKKITQPQPPQEKPPSEKKVDAEEKHPLEAIMEQVHPLPVPPAREVVKTKPPTGEPARPIELKPACEP